LAIYAQPKTRGRGASAAAPLRELGVDPGVRQAGRRQGRPVRPLCHRWPDQRDTAQGRRSRDDHRGSGHELIAEKRARGPVTRKRTAAKKSTTRTTSRATHGHRQADRPTPLVVMLADSTRRALSHWVTQTQAAARQPSLVAAAARDGEVVWWHGAGSVGGRGGATPTAGTAYRIASITKTFVAVAVLRLVESGTTRPRRRGRGGGAGRARCPGDGRAVAQPHLGAAGRDRWQRGGSAATASTWDELTSAGLTRRLPAGRAYHYSNVGYAVLGRLLETIHRQPWDEVLAREVIRPLGLRGTGRVPDSSMAAVGWAVHPHADLLHREPVPDYRAMGAAGELWSTVADLACLGVLPGRPP
jgi:CubicO group peptidase (beta-lactamase class C family)